MFSRQEQLLQVGFSTKTCGLCCFLTSPTPLIKMYIFQKEWKHTWFISFELSLFNIPLFFPSAILEI